MKKLFAIAMAALMVMSVVACGDSAASTTAAATTAAATTAATTAAAEATTAAADTTTAAASTDYAYPACSDSTPVVEIGTFDKSAVKESYAVTAVGQSADIDVVAKLLDKAGVTYTSDTLLMADGLDGVGTLFVAAGASTKGLGTAGISQDDELARAEELFAACESKGITVVLCHVGGSARRGTLSDQFTDLVMAAADYMVVVEEGNSDNYFTDYAAANNVPIALVKSMSSAVTPITALFN